MKLKSWFVVTALVVVPISVFANPAGDKIIAQIDQMKRLSFSPGTSEAERAKAIDVFVEKRNKLVLELYRTDPGNPKMADLMLQSWLDANVRHETPGARATRVDAQIDDVLAHNPTEALREVGAYAKAMVAADKPDERDPLPIVNAFIAAYPKSERGADLLFRAASKENGNEKTATYQRIVNNYPVAREIARYKGALRQSDSVGKPLELHFKDAITGSQVDVSAMKGKVVLIDFWATWCEPCKAEMPQLKALYEKYHDQGLEVIGVSLDSPESSGGLASLKKYAAQNQIPWPQYFQGNGVSSEFSSGWGIYSIPTMFVVDKQGNYLGVDDIRNKEFEAKLQKLLSEK